MLQTDDLQPLTSYHILQHVSCPNGGKLVHIPDENDAGTAFHGPQESLHQGNIHHGTFIDDDDIGFDGVILVFIKGLAAVILADEIDAQHAMDGLGFYACGLRHPLGRPARGRCQNHIQVFLLQDADDGIDGGGFPGAGAAGDDEDTVGHGFRHGHALLQGQGHASFLFYPANLFCDSFHIRRVILRRQFQQPLRHGHFRIKIIIQINTIHAIQLFLPNLAVHLQFPDGIFHGQRMQFQKLHRLFDERFLGQEAVTVTRGSIQNIFHRRLHPVGVIGGNAGAGRHFVGHFEANAHHIIRQAVGVIFHHLKGAVFILFINTHGIGRGNIEALQKHHSPAQFMLFTEGFGNFLGFIEADALDLRQHVGLFFDDIEGGLPKAFHDALGRFGPDALDHAGGKVFFHACYGGGHGFFIILHLDLPAVQGVHRPVAPDLQGLAAVDIGNGAHAGHLIILCGQGKNRVAVILILIDDILHFANDLQIFHAFTSLSCLFFHFNENIIA